MAYKVILQVGAKQLPTLLSTIEGTKGIDLLSLTLDKDEERRTIASPAAPRYVNGKKDKGILGPDLVIQTIDNGSGRATRNHLVSALKTNGFSPNSLSPIISRLVRDGKVEQKGEFYHLKK